MTAAQAELAKARDTNERIRANGRQRVQAAEVARLKAASDALTAAMDARKAAREKALAEADMPIAGLGIADIDGKLRVTLDGEPFSQSSGAQRIKVSTSIAIAANPKLRVCRIKDGSLLDQKNMAILGEMATEHDFQVWIETVGEEGAGIIMEAGRVKGAPEPERVEAPKRRKKAEDGVVEMKVAEGSDEIKAGDAVISTGPGEVSKAPAPQAEPPVERERPKAVRSFSTKPGGTLFDD